MRQDRVVTFKAEPELVEKMDKLARKLGISRSQLIKQAIKHLLNDLAQKH